MSGPYDGRLAEVLTGPGYGRGWWFFDGELQARNVAAERTGGVAKYFKTAAKRENPAYPGVFGTVWKERS